MQKSVADFIALHKDKIAEYLKKKYKAPDTIIIHAYKREDSFDGETTPPPRPLPTPSKTKGTIKYSDRGGDVRYSDRESAPSDISPKEILQMLDDGVAIDVVLHAISRTSELSFSQKLMCYMRAKDLVASDIYRAAQMDRRLFSKILSDSNYQPAKDTVLALICALELSIVEANNFLNCAGYAISHSIRRDVILEYFIQHKVYNLDYINAFLYQAGEKVIGRSS